MQPSVIAGVGVVAVATVAGTWLARRRPGRQEVWFGAAAGALLVIAGLHLLPDAWREAGGRRPWVPVAAAAACGLAWLVARYGCACDEDAENASGAGTAGALAVHRFLEGSALALTGSITVAVALAAHAFGEGLAVGALLARKRHLVIWLTAMCVGPAVGAAAASIYPEPLLVAAAAGVLIQAARISLRAAFRHIRPRALLLSPPAAAVAVAAMITALAVHAAG
jgi:ZIP family zinc transporter